MGAWAKSYGLFLVGLLIALMVLQFLLNQGKKLPVVGPIVGDAQNLANEGHL